MNRKTYKSSILLLNGDSISLVWYEIAIVPYKYVVDIYRLKLEPGHTYRIGREPESDELCIMDERSRQEYKMGRSNRHVSLISPGQNKYGSVVIQCDEDGNIKIARARNSREDVCISPLPGGTFDDALRLPDEDEEMINLSEKRRKLFGIYVPPIPSEEYLIAYLYMGTEKL